MSAPAKLPSTAQSAYHANGILIRRRNKQVTGAKRPASALHGSISLAPEQSPHAARAPQIYALAFRE